MKDRFEGPNRQALIDALLRQNLVGNNNGMVNELITNGELMEFADQTELIKQGDSTNDVYLLVAGTVTVAANGVELRTLKAGDHVGEITAIEPSIPRAATVYATGMVVALKLTSASFNAVCDKFPVIAWKSIAREMAFRLQDRNRLLRAPNDQPKLFIISSVEALDVANEIQSGLQRDCLPTVWTNGVFWAGGYPLESLERAVSEADFAVAVAQFEDTVTSRGSSHTALRDNVVFELGLFMGQLGRRRTILVHPQLPALKLPSDLVGITTVSYQQGKPADLPVSLGPVCTEIRKVIRRERARTHAS